MFKRNYFIAALLLCTLSLAAQSPGEQSQWVNTTVSGMSLKEKVGQLLVYSLPVNTNTRYKKSLEQIIKDYHIGGVMYSYGNISDQIGLVNAVQKHSPVPLLLSVDAGLGLSAYLKGAPDFPHPTAVKCIADGRLVTDYNREISRVYGLLGVHTNEISDGMVVTTSYDLEDTQQKLLNSVKNGELSEQEIDNRCRKVLARKYELGVNNPSQGVPAKQLTAAVITPEALELAGRLRKAAITVLGNESPVLPLIKEGIAVLCVGDEGSDSTFLAAMRKHAEVKEFRLTDKTGDAGREQITRELKDYKRVIVSITADPVDVRLHRRFLTGLDVPAPLIYVAFSSYRTLQMLIDPLKRVSAVVLAHSAHEDVQQQTADVLFAQAAANGKLSVDIGTQYPQGRGIEIVQGMQAGGVVPEDYGLRSYILYNNVDRLLDRAINSGHFPGCQVAIYKDGQPVYNKCFGVRSDRDQTPVKPTDMYDIGTLTKTTATLLAVMKLYDEGKLKLDDKVVTYLPVFRSTDKADITIRELLLHESGLHPYIRFYRLAIDEKTVNGPFFQGFEDEWHRTRSGESTYAASGFKFVKGLMSEQQTATHTMQMAENMWLDSKFKNTIMQSIAKSELERKRFIYSNLGFLVLQQIVEEITQMPLDKYLEQEFYAPMGLNRTLFLPLNRYDKENVMPTVSGDYLRGQDLQGFVHDEIAACLGGVAGNAGLFSTSTEVAQVYLMLSNGGEYKGKRYLSEETCRLFTTERSAVSHRGLGFDKPYIEKPLENACSPSTPAEAYGEAGFIGTCAWADPVNKVVYVFLSNRMCPHAWNLKMIDSKLRENVQEVIYNSMRK